MPQDFIDASPSPKELTRDLNFKVPKEFHRRFKYTAAALDIQMRDLLIKCFEEYVEKHKHEVPGI